MKALNILELNERVTRLERVLAGFSRLMALEVPDESMALVSGIQCLAAQHYGITLEQLVGRSKLDGYKWPRGVAIWLCRKHTCLSAATIAARFGKRDHSTVVHLVKSVQDRLDTDPRFAGEVRLLERRIVERRAHD